MRFQVLLSCVVIIVYGEDTTYEIADPATLFDILPDYTQKLLKDNANEVSSWSPMYYKEKNGNGLLSPHEAALQRKWHEWNQHITMNGNIDSARLIASFGIMPIISNNNGNELHKASILGDLNKIKKILNDPDTTMDIDNENSDGSTSLILATVMGHENIVKYLLKQGALTEIETNTGANALHFGVILNHTNIVKTLIKYNANIDKEHKFAKSTPLHFAVEMGHTEIIKILCDNGANINAPKTNGGRPIHIAVEANQLESLKTLINECNVDLESKLMNDTTAMYLAALNGNELALKILINAGANMDAIMPTVSRKDVMTADDSKGKYGNPNIPNPDYDGFYYPDKNQEIGNGATPLHGITIYIISKCF